MIFHDGKYNAHETLLELSDFSETSSEPCPTVLDTDVSVSTEVAAGIAACDDIGGVSSLACGACAAAWSYSSSRHQAGKVMALFRSGSVSRACASSANIWSRQAAIISGVACCGNHDLSYLIVMPYVIP